MQVLHWEEIITERREGFRFQITAVPPCVLGQIPKPVSASMSSSVRWGGQCLHSRIIRVCEDLGGWALKPLLTSSSSARVTRGGDTISRNGKRGASFGIKINWILSMNW